MSTAEAAAELDLVARWRAAWPRALEVWSRFTRLSDPWLMDSRIEAAREGLHGSFAMIRLSDQSVVVDLQTIHELGLDDYSVEILAHEIGHHVLAPASATDHYRLMARIRRALPTLEKHSAMVGNLFTDLLINDRLQRRSSLRMADIYRLLREDAERRAQGRMKNTIHPKAGGVWTLYTGIYEQLWKLDAGSLGGPVDDPALQTDAWLGARLVRAYADEWLVGAGSFASLLLPYLVDAGEAPPPEQLKRLHDTKDAAQGCEPSGLTELEPGEGGMPLHPNEDPRVTGEDSEEAIAPPAPAAGSDSSLRGQRREPFEYGEILRAAGVRLEPHDIAIRYYRESALPHLVPFPTRPAPRSHEPLPEGYEAWDLGDPLDEIDWIGTVTTSPRVFPGLTTVRRQVGIAEERVRSPEPVDLDLYVDCSGSMPNPQIQVSYLALAGAIIVLSALRTGSRVQATLWSGKHQVLSTPGFVRDENAVLRVLTGYLGGATAFPIHVLRDTFSARGPRDRACHILMISDDGITTMFDQDEKGNAGWDVSARALAAARAGGTMALRLPSDWETSTMKTAWWDPALLRRARSEQGWEIHSIAEMEDLIEFARGFARRRYLDAKAAA